MQEANPLPKTPFPVSNVVPTQIVKKLSLGDKPVPVIIAAIVVVVLGIGTGFLLSGKSLASNGPNVPGAKTSPNEAGLADEKTFRDSAEGELQEGGINGEGTHHLIRTGGDSQTVYLTSTVIDLQSFVGKKVTVWGETVKARKAAWLMDVGKIKVIQ